MTIPVANSLLDESDQFQRIVALARYRVQNVSREKEFDKIAELVVDTFAASACHICILNGHVQYLGMGGSVELASFSHQKALLLALQGQAPVFLTGSGPSFYAGMPLRVANGPVLGLISIMSEQPHCLSESEVRRLEKFADTVVDLIELRAERYAANEQTRRFAAKRAFLKLAIEHLRDGVVIIDRDLRISLWNEALPQLLGFNSDDVYEGMFLPTFANIIKESCEYVGAKVDELFDDYSTLSEITASQRFEVKSRTGRTLEIWFDPIVDSGFVMTARDVTDERQIAQFKDELISTVSHELRTPLTSIIGALGLINLGSQNPSAARLLDIARRNADRLMVLVNDLLHMDKLQSGKVSFVFEEADLTMIVRDALDYNQTFAAHHGTTLSCVCPDKPLLVRVDPGRILQVLNNLISNACKFSAPGMPVVVTAREDQGQAVLSVSDKGPGIAPEFRPRLFHRFAQEDGLHQQGHNGTGLGLAITRQIVEAHGGTIEHDTTVVEGTTFHVRLPLISEHSALPVPVEQNG